MNNLTSAQISILLKKGNISNNALYQLEKDKRITVKILVKQYKKRLENKIKEDIRLEKMLQYENMFINQGYSLIAGIDEVGRGSLAGPVVAAVVIFLKNIKIINLNDSKKLSQSMRKKIFVEIKKKALTYNFAIVDVKTIDKINIHQASKLAMYKAIEGLKLRPKVIISDAMPLPDIKDAKVFSITKADEKSLSVAAASIMAKVIRDEIMDKLDELYPWYGFVKHKGYGTKKHMEALFKYGITSEHRKTFSPISIILNSQTRVID